MGVNDAYWICAQSGVTPVAFADPGQGKTQNAYAFGQAVQREVYVLIPSMRDATDFYGCPIGAETEIGVNGSKRKTQVMRIANPEWAVQCWDGRPWIIFLDELTTAVPLIQSCLLRIIAEKHVGEIPLPDNVWILGAANPPESAPNGVEFSPPLANRVYHHKWEVDRDAVLQGFAAGMDFGTPDFPRVPDDWEKYLGPMGGLVAAFHKRNPGRLDKMPTDVAEQSGPWPSQRTWEYAVRAISAAEACGAGKAIQHTLVAGLVGEAVALEFQQYRDNLDLPDPECLIRAAKVELEGGVPMSYDHPDRPDKVMAMLASVSAALAQRNDVKRWEAAMLVMEKAADQELEVALAVAKPLAAQMPKGGRYSGEFVGRLFPRIQVALGIST